MVRAVLPHFKVCWAVLLRHLCLGEVGVTWTLIGFLQNSLLHVHSISASSLAWSDHIPAQLRIYLAYVLHDFHVRVAWSPIVIPRQISIPALIWLRGHPHIQIICIDLRESLVVVVYLHGSAVQICLDLFRIAFLNWIVAVKTIYTLRLVHNVVGVLLIYHLVNLLDLIILDPSRSRPARPYGFYVGPWLNHASVSGLPIRIHLFHGNKIWILFWLKMPAHLGIHTLRLLTTHLAASPKGPLTLVCIKAL